ncbi:transketolase [Cryptococcus depauperatus CBS 7841]|uniref:Transketolase n=1 Tax=Cryptococcus depauperatus CBS 7841 TaxID=1295531 RepID=A0A1E3HS97_9TREE|nr:transketolase [Cryptococcus depauperatus CBS 7841]
MSAINKTDLTSVNTIRALAADVVAKANSGHPGAPMGMAPISHILFTRFMRFNPKNPKWINRDRFVLSNGHACALQYILLHLAGYDVSMDDLKQFRQVNSITPGHPELGVTPGIEVTTGPLGQGISNAVGLAIGQAHMGAIFNKEGFPLIDNYTYVFVGDGCLQEGVASEACSLAGHLKLGNLIAIYDDNKITIDGDTAVSFTENVEMRFKSYGWNVLHVEKGDDDLAAIENAVNEARKNTDAPTIINLKTTIGFGSLKAGGHDVHGAPLKKDDIVQLKKKFGFSPDETFAVPQETYDVYRQAAERGTQKENEWHSLFKSYAEKYPHEASEFQRRIDGRLPDGWEKALPTYTSADAAVGSRKLSETTITKLVEVLPELVGGSADLTGSNLTRWKNAEDFQHPSTGLGSYKGRYFRFGVREHGMTAICNGIAAYGGLIPFGATFLNFVSYAAGAVRLSALSHLRVIQVATHDSIGLGEDGPTHQPVETAAWLRAIPNLAFWRPADGNETSASYLVALLSQHTPSVLAFSRQNLPQLANSSIEKAAKGGYVLEEVENADVTLVSTGSEVALCLQALEQLKSKNIKARLVSLPCFEAFNAQPKEYKLSVLPSGAPILSVEAYSTFGWGAYSHDHFGLQAWGASGPFAQVYEKFDMTPDGIAKRAEKVVSFYKKRGQPVFSPLISALDEITE